MLGLRTSTATLLLTRASMAASFDPNIAGLKQHFKESFLAGSARQPEDMIVPPDGPPGTWDDDTDRVHLECRPLFDEWLGCSFMITGQDVDVTDDDDKWRQVLAPSSDLVVEQYHEQMCAYLDAGDINCEDTLDETDAVCADEWYAAFNCYFTVQCKKPSACSKLETVCTNTCPFAKDGECNSFGLCPCGTDCSDCGPEACPNTPTLPSATETTTVDAQAPTDDHTHAQKPAFDASVTFALFLFALLVAFFMACKSRQHSSKAMHHVILPVPGSTPSSDLSKPLLNV